MKPDDVVRAADCVAAALGPAIGREWTVRAGRLDWDVDRTLAHLTGAAAKYTLYLASRSTRFMAVTTGPWPGATQTRRIDAIGLVARALANVAEAAPQGARAYHANGMFDAEGYVAMGCLEMLVHGHDVAEGLGLPFSPPEDLCEALVARLFPWLDGGWEPLLRYTGREGPPGDDTWTLHAGLLDEWDGSIPVQEPRAVVEWVYDERTRAWEPHFLEGA